MKKFLILSVILTALSCQMFAGSWFNLTPAQSEKIEKAKDKAKTFYEESLERSEKIARERENEPKSDFQKRMENMSEAERYELKMTIRNLGGYEALVREPNSGYTLDDLDFVIYFYYNYY